MIKLQRREKSLQITKNLFANFGLQNVRYLHLFLSIAEKGEIENFFIYQSLLRHFPDVKVIVPRVNFEKDFLQHIEMNNNTLLQINRWGIPEAVGDEFIDEKKLDIVLVPMLCFDERGFRVGYGKGFYDKFLSKCREDCLKVGLSFFAPVDEIEDINDFDVKLDYCITPQKIWEF